MQKENFKAVNNWLWTVFAFIFAQVSNEAKVNKK